MSELNTISLAELFDTIAAVFPESVYRIESLELGDENPEWAWMGEAKLIPFGHKGQALYVDEIEGYKVVDLEDFQGPGIRLIPTVNYFADGEWSNGSPIEFEESFDNEDAAFDDAVSRFNCFTKQEQSRVKWIGVRRSDGDTADRPRLINLDTFEWAD